MSGTKLLVLALFFASAFTEVAEQTGLRFQHYNGMTGKFYLPEITGSGAVLFDFDNDGDLDVFVVQGNVLESRVFSAAAYFGFLTRNFVARLRSSSINCARS